MAKYRRFNLVKSEAALKKFVRTKDFRALSSADKEFILSLNNSIATLHNLRGWNRQGGRIAEYRARRQQALSVARDASESTPTLTQDDIIADAVEADIGSRTLVIKVLTTMQMNIQNRLNRSSSAAFKNMLTKLQINNEAILSVIHEQPYDRDPTNHPLGNGFAIATNLGGRYLPASQGFDPLQGAEKEKKEGRYQKSLGHCFGHVMNWRDEITKTGTSTLLNQQTNLSATYQKKQNFKIGLWSNHNKGKLIVRARMHPAKSLRASINETLIALSPHHTYALSIYWREPPSGHATGIRLLPSGEYEFYDPNFGLFIFDNRERLADWITLIINTYNKDFSQNGEIFLRQIGNQPPHAVASIPRIDRPTFNPEDNTVEKFNELQEDTFIVYDKSRDRIKCFSQLSNDYINSICVRIKSFGTPDGDTQLGEKMIGAQRRVEELAHQAYSDEEFQLRTMEIKKERATLKETAITIIQHEIERVRHLPNNPKKHEILLALPDLISQISNSDATSLSTLIDRWLETNAHAIAGRKTEKVIAHLQKHHEIIPYRLSLLREKLWLRIVEAVNADWSQVEMALGGVRGEDNKKMPHTILALRHKVAECIAEGKSVEACLAEVKKIGKQSYGNFLYAALRWRSSAVNKFYLALSKIDVNDPYLLADIDHRVAMTEKWHLKLAAPTPAPTPSAPHHKPT